MFEAIGYNLKRLFDISGREARPPFWWYVLFTVLLYFAASMLQGFVLSIGLIGDVIANPDSGGDISQQMTARMISMLGPQMAFSAILAFIMMVLLAAAFVRRLHDGGFSGLVALIPAGLMVAGLLLSYLQLDEVQAALSAATTAEELEAAAYSLTRPWQVILGWLPYVIFAVLGAWPSQKTANRWGDFVPPVPKTGMKARQPARMVSGDDEV